MAIVKWQSRLDEGAIGTGRTFDKYLLTLAFLDDPIEHSNG